LVATDVLGSLGRAVHGEVIRSRDDHHS
jgi:hypothetical protein